ncbi:MAG: aminopeptidase N [Magnetococcales bacterium]|nr:aminopeptidase N [Magnetococcales bacterium]
MSEKPKTVTRLADYTPPAWLVDHVHLDFRLFADQATVHARLTMRRNPEVASGPSETPLWLDGRELELLALRLDGVALPGDRYQQTGEGLRIFGVGQACVLETEVRIHPETNLSLEGLYRSGSLFCTQCEAEGFRKITFYLDRPDVMARFTVSIEADRSVAPVLLANGNLKERGERPGNRHYALWEDPFPKPCYLFCLVAGDLVCREDFFTTFSGRRITLQVWVEPENGDKCRHALDSLQKSMAWDEQRFGREYDLDLYMIVAVNDFNMGAMENKGLNLFNAQYVLADAQTATDSNYEEIESVIAHEYFHNWTGNRVTCRDWFQLSLKEGLTIFRDQSFSAEVGSRSVQRIRAVNDLRSGQFPEDNGPTAHPVRPDTYMEINNFYTSTIYNKGGEVVRMLEVLIGKERFRRGMDLYFERHDGQAVTVEDFVAAMESASQRDLSQFMRWYRYPGTPELTVRWEHDPVAHVFCLDISQHCQAPNQEQPAPPFHMPVVMALLDPVTGAPMPLRLEGQGEAVPEMVLELTQASHRFCFTGLAHAPIPSLLRGFSAPVKLRAPYGEEDLAFLWGAEGNPFNRWDAGQELATRILLRAARDPAGGMAPHPLFLRAFAATLEESRLEPALIALAITLPGLTPLLEKMTPADPEALHQAREGMRRHLALTFREELMRVYERHLTPGPYRRDPGDIGRRTLKNLALSYLMALPDNGLPTEMALRQLREADNMTDRLGAMIPLVHADRPEAPEILAEWENRWRENPLALDKWFAIQASAPVPHAVERVRELMRKPQFQLRNPNRVRAVIGTFCRQNLSRFHDPSGEGYRLAEEVILALDPDNPQVAARLAGVFSRWRRFEPLRREAMHAALSRIVAVAGLSRNTYEIVSKSLG